MSELKAGILVTPHNEGMCFHRSSAVIAVTEGETEFYLKSEADAVIAELKAQKAQAEDDCAYWKMCHGNAANAMHETEEAAMQLYKEARHHKYKRCLAMAEWCESRSNKLFEDTLYVRDMGLEPSDELTFKLAFFRKWEKRWLELAKKFKEEN